MASVEANPGNDFDLAYTIGQEPKKYLENVHYVKGWFNETLPPFLDHHKQLLRLHIDCDLFSSSSYVLNTIAPRLQNETVILFDELINYPGFEKHEMLALWMFLLRNSFDIRVLSGAPVVRSPLNDYWPQSVTVQLLSRPYLSTPSILL